MLRVRSLALQSLYIDLIISLYIDLIISFINSKAFDKGWCQDTDLESLLPNPVPLVTALCALTSTLSRVSPL